MKSQPPSDDAIRLGFILFAQKDNAKKWVYCLPTNSISKWDEFVKTFLKKFYSMHKMARIRNAINQFQQVGGEPFWKHLERFKNLLAQCPRHAIEKWLLCQIVYEGLDYTSKPLLEFMYQGELHEEDRGRGMRILRRPSEKTVMWESFNEKPPHRTPHQKATSIP